MFKSILFPFEAYSLLSITLNLLSSSLYGEGGQLLPSKNMPTNIEDLPTDINECLVSLLQDNDIRWSVAERITNLDPDNFQEIAKIIEHSKNDKFASWMGLLLDHHKWIISHPSLFTTVCSLYIYRNEEDNE